LAVHPRRVCLLWQGMRAGQLERRRVRIRVQQSSSDSPAMLHRSAAPSALQKLYAIDSRLSRISFAAVQ
jgi:hypothetical protein